MMIVFIFINSMQTGVRKQKMPALISTIMNFLDIHGIDNKSGDFSLNVLENKILEKNVSSYYLLPWQQSFQHHVW